MALCVLKYPSANATEKGLLDAEFRAKPAAAMGVWQVPGRITRPGTFERQQKDHRDLLADSRYVPAGRRYRCKVSIRLLCPRPGTAAPVEMDGWPHHWQPGIFFHFAMWFPSCSTSKWPSPI